MLLLFACNDYNLANPPSKTEDEAPEDTAVEEPPPSEEPDIDVSPESVDFATIMKDCPADPITVTITNKGKAKLKVSDISLNGDAVSKFDETGEAVELKYGETYDFKVKFTPTAYVTYAVDLDITSNDPDESELTVPVAGTGASGSIYEESFEQDYIDDVIDVLWVIDNSGSMEESQQRLIDQFDLFIGAFLSLGLDYHIGVVTTDMSNPDQSGRLQGNPAYIDSSTADPVNAFAKRAAVGAGGSGDEKGLDATKAALTDPILSNENAGFLRSGSVISAIVVSDENDSSSVNAGGFTSWFEALRSDKDYTSFNAIVGDRGLGCTGGDIFAGDFIEAMGGDTYIDVADNTGGFFASICTEDFDVAVTNMARSSAGMKSSFELAKTPSDLSQMTVQIDGSDVPYDAVDGWSYDSTNNAVQFHGAYFPDGGSVIDVAYPYDSSCN
jgi:hypothetical protein